VPGRGDGSSPVGGAVLEAVGAAWGGAIAVGAGDDAAGMDADGGLAGVADGGHADGHAEDASVDLLPHFAGPLPIEVSCELVGIPEADRPRWRGYGAPVAALRADTTLTPRAVEELLRWCGPLVRVETEVALSALVRRFPDLALTAPGDVARTPDPGTWRLTSLPVNL
jgi:cytochrome P450